MRVPLPIALFLALHLAAGPASADPAGAEKLARGTPFETTVHLRRSGRPGPTVLIVAGMHGDERAGRRAAEQIRHWPIARGRLLVLPRANAPGCARGTRLVPDKRPFDLNRRFPSRKGAAPKTPLARAIWSLCVREKPDWVLDLHESVDYRHHSTKGRKFLGHTVIVHSDPEMTPMGERLVEAANRGTLPGKGRWVLLRRPIEGCLARAAAARLSSHAAIVESCRKDYLSVRVRHHRLVAHRLLEELEMLPEGLSPDTYFPAKKPRGEIRVALYNSTGTGGSSAYVVERCLPPLGAVVSHRLTASAIRNGALRDFDVVVFPGGTGTGTARALKAKGRAAVREFIGNGGGYLGICAGAYLATRHYSWSLGILDAKVLDTRHWARGKGNVRISFTETGRKLFGLPRAEAVVRYAQGPLLAAGGDPETPDFEVLAIYRTEIAKNGAPKGVMAGTPAIVRGRYGKGRVLVMSPHPEQTKGLRSLVRTAVLWLAER